MNGEIALEKLLAGNERFVSNKLEHPNRSDEARERALFIQQPFAVILGCSDSRVPLEIIFDQGIGDLFVIRSAGNVLDDVALESIRFGVRALGASLVFVLGHENCGAVGAVMDKKTELVPTIAKKIESALKGDGNPIVENVLHVVEQIKKDPQIEGTLVKGGFFDLKTGEVIPV